MYEMGAQNKKKVIQAYFIFVVYALNRRIVKKYENAVLMIWKLKTKANLNGIMILSSTINISTSLNVSRSHVIFA